MVDHAPAAAVAAGDVLVLGDAVRIADRDIPANVLGALAAGDGVYREVAKAAEAIGDGDAVYWDAGNARLTTAATGNAAFGKAVGSYAAGDATMTAHHLA